MEEIELKFSAKPRLREAPDCPCGEPQSKTNPQFAPYKDCDGKYGYCHRCDRTFRPGDTEQKTYVIKPIVKAKQQFVPEPTNFHSRLVDTVLGEEIDGARKVTWYYRNLAGKLTSAKEMYYDKDFKRIKDRHPLFIYQRESGYYHCLFNEHALTKHPQSIVILVESEKTAAALTTRINPTEFIFLATGGSQGLSEDKLPPLKGREVWICYDCDASGREAAQTAYLKLVTIANAKVIDLDPVRTAGEDLYDLPQEQQTADFIRAAAVATRTPIPPALIDTLKQMNRDGFYLTTERIAELGEAHGINGDRIIALNKTITDQFKAESNISRAHINIRVKQWLSTHYEFRRNVLNSIVTMKRQGQEWEPINTATLWDDANCDSKAIGKGAKGKDLTIAKTMIDNLIDSAFVPAFNPLVDYFENLPAWDGKTDHLTALANHVKTDNQPFWNSMFKKALRRMVACSLYGHLNRFVVVLVSPKQHLGKSEFIRHLCPPVLKDHYKEQPWSDHKDSSFALTENFIWNMEELDGIRKDHLSNLKGVISTSNVNERRPFARHAEQKPRIVNFWGSTNKTDFLIDVENTRWLCFNVLSIDHNYNNTVTKVKNIDIDAVWAQAYAEYHLGKPFLLDSEEMLAQKVINENFEAYPAEQQLILKHFERITPTGDDDLRFISNEDICVILAKLSNNSIKISPQNIGRAMARLEYRPFRKKINKHTYRGYYAVFNERGIAFGDQPAEEKAPELPF